MELQRLLNTSLLQEWIDPSFLHLQKLRKLQKLFLVQKPFPHLVLANFLVEGKANAILKAVKKEQFHLKEADLFQFLQTNDFLGARNSILREFRELLRSKEFILYLCFLTCQTLKEGAVDMAGTIYRDTDYLLCHDDQLEGRSIAYLYYLSTLSKNDGGSLNLFASNDGVPTIVAKKILPSFNTFTFFLVSPLSFHEVEEVVHTVQRITVGGWFYGRD